MSRQKQTPLDPFRPADWRWQQASAPDDAGRPFRRTADPAVRAAARFWLAWSACRTEGEHRLLEARAPDLYRAYALYRASGASRHALEARILANEPAADIARKASLRPEVVSAYEVLFYDVRTRLSSSDFICIEVIGPALQSRRWNYATAWKVFGFLGGACVLDAVMGVYPSGSRPARPEAVAAFLGAETRAALARRLAAAARAPGAAGADAALLAAHARPRGPAAEDEALHSALERHVQAFLAEIPWISGTEGTAALPAQLAQYDGGAAELRDDELLQVAADAKPTGLEGLKALVLPPPRPKKAGVAAPGGSLLDAAEGAAPPAPKGAKPAPPQPKGGAAK